MTEQKATPEQFRTWAITLREAAVKHRQTAEELDGEGRKTHLQIAAYEEGRAEEWELEAGKATSLKTIVGDVFTPTCTKCGKSIEGKTSSDGRWLVFRDDEGRPIHWKCP